VFELEHAPFASEAGATRLIWPTSQPVRKDMQKLRFRVNLNVLGGITNVDSEQKDWRINCYRWWELVLQRHPMSACIEKRSISVFRPVIVTLSSLRSTSSLAMRTRPS